MQARKEKIIKKILSAILVGTLALLSACSSSKETQEGKEVNEMVEVDTRLDLSVFKNGSLNYYNIGIENPKIVVRGNDAMITYTSILDANAYGAKGVYRMQGVHKFKKIGNKWYSSN